MSLPSVQKVAASEFFTNRKDGPIITQPGRVDVNGCINSYYGHPLVVRLFELGQCSVFHSVEALRKIIERSRALGQLKAYTKAVAILKLVSPEDPAAEYDGDWVDSHRAVIRAQVKRMTGDVQTHKANMIKESVRASLMELASYHYKIGNLVDAARCFQKALVYCQRFQQRLELYIRLMLIYAIAESWDRLEAVAKKVPLADGLDPIDPGFRSFILTMAPILMGLVQLQKQNFAVAASYFSSALHDFSQPEECRFGQWEFAIVPIDVALYGTLTILASQGHRYKSTTQLLNVEFFSSYVRLNSTARHVARLYSRLEFPELLNYLTSFRNDFLLDPYLQPHVDQLLGAIREKLLIAYCGPFTTIRLSTIQRKFRPTTEEIGGMPTEKEIVSMIQNFQLDWKYDEEKMIMTRNSSSSDTVHTAINDLFSPAFNLSANLYDPALVRGSMVQACLAASGAVIVPDIWSYSTGLIRRVESRLDLMKNMAAERGRLKKDKKNVTSDGEATVRQPSEASGVESESVVLSNEMTPSTLSPGDAVIVADPPEMTSQLDTADEHDDPALEARQKAEAIIKVAKEMICREKAKDLIVDWNILEIFTTLAELDLDLGSINDALARGDKTGAGVDWHSQSFSSRNMANWLTREGDHVMQG